MIRRLRTRLILLTAAGLFLASAILVAAINYMNLRSLSAQTEEVLTMLSENGGRRPMLRMRNGLREGKDAPEKPEGTPPPKPAGDRGNPRSDAARSAAERSNYFLAHLAEDGTVKSWESDRSDLYTDQQISDFAAETAALGKASGRIGSQFFRRSDSQLIVVDATLDFQNADRFLRTTVLVAVLQWAVLTAGAVWLICRMIKPVDEAMEKQKQFIWDASHELKTPLAVISANAEVLAGEIGENQSLQHIQSEVRRTDQLVQNLLTLARVEKNADRTARTEFDLSRALLSVALPFESVVYEAGKSIDMDIPEGVSYAGDEEMIKQLTIILLGNAVKYSDEHGRLFLALETRGDKRIIRVRNTGPAIPAADQEKIFDRFFRVDSSHNREIPGNGLGLAIARNIVEIHKGKITVRSQEGFGTEFTVTL